jgi:hypothetical protein
MNTRTGLAPLPASPLARATNPFATRWVRPGALPYQFPPGGSAATIMTQFEKSNWRGAVIGPHGSGKSTLLAALVPVIEQTGRIVRMVTLHDGQRRLPADFLESIAGDRPTIAIVDGFEQLGWWARRRLKFHCHGPHCGLLVSAHVDAGACGLAVLFRTTTSLAVFAHLVEHHLPFHNGLIRPADFAAAFDACHGNLRNSFFSLYHLFERRRRAA